VNILDQIVAVKREEVARLRPQAGELKQAATARKDFRDFAAALRRTDAVALVAEIKKASPSKGVLNPNLDPERQAVIYTEAGACAISVVTEEDFFLGDLSWIRRIRRASSLPVLRKDFIFEAFQIYETRAAGASAILFIVAMLEPAELKEFIALAQEQGLDALVEIHDEVELEEALRAGASIIGVNNRDLKTFSVDVSTSLRLARLIPDECVFVVESGLTSRADIERLLEAGADAFLVGEHLVGSADPAARLRGLL